MAFFFLFCLLYDPVATINAVERIYCKGHVDFYLLINEMELWETILNSSSGCLLVVHIYEIMILPNNNKFIYKMCISMTIYILHIDFLY